MTAQTSLAAQLERLETPQTSQFKQKRGRTSFLYDYLEAASVDCDTHYSVAVSGLETLTHLDPSIGKYRKTLLDETSRNFERGIRTAEDNLLLDQDVEKCLYHVVTPYFLQSAAHKVLEWLIYKYHVNEYNSDALVICLLPYHETRFYPKLLQTIRDFKKKSNKWHFLREVQKAGTPLPKSVIISKCLSDPWLLSMIAESVKKVCEVTRNCNTVVSFATSIMLGVLKFASDPNVFQIVTEYIMDGFKSDSIAYVLSAYTVAAFFSSKCNLEPQLLNQMLKTSCRRFKKCPLNKSCLEEYLVLVAIICKTQDVVLSQPVVDIICQEEKLLQKWPSDELKSCLLNYTCEHLTESGSVLRLEKILKSMKCISKKTKKRLADVLLSPSIWSGNNEEFQVHLLCLLLNISLGSQDIRKTLLKLDMSGQFACRVMEKLTIVTEDDSRRRIPFSLSSENWRQMAILLEVFKDKKQFSGCNHLIESCFVLLKESFVTEEESGSEYWRRLLLSCISNCLRQEHCDMSLCDVQSIIECLRHIRKREGQQECLNLLNSVSHQKKEDILQHIILNFGFVGSNFIRSDDDFTLEILDQTLDLMLPTLMESNDLKTIDPVLDVFIDAFLDIPSHRRLKLFCRLLSSPRDELLYSVVMKLMLRCVSADSIHRFIYSDFAAELTSTFDISTQTLVRERISKSLDRLTNGDEVSGRGSLADGISLNLNPRDKKVLRIAFKKFILYFSPDGSTRDETRKSDVSHGKK